MQVDWSDNGLDQCFLSNTANKLSPKVSFTLDKQRLKVQVKKTEQKSNIKAEHGIKDIMRRLKSYDLSARVKGRLQIG